MNTRRTIRTVRLCVAAWPLLTLTLGCATLKGTLGGGGLDQRKQRHDQTARHVEQQRDQAEFQSALGRFDRQDLAGCRQDCDRILARNPAHREAQLLMADVLLSEGNPKEAQRHVQCALQAHPHDADVHYAMGLTLDAAGDSAAALTYYEQAAKMAPDNELYTVGYRAAAEAAGSGEGRRTPPPAPSKQPGAPRKLQVAEAKPLPRAAAAKEKAAEVEVSDGPAQTPTGVASASSRAANCREEREGNGPADSADAMGDPAVHHLEQGYAALIDGQAAKAVEHFRQAAATDPNNPQILIAAGAAALRYNRPQVAVDLLAPGVKRFDRSAAMLRTLGMAYYRLGSYQSSQSALQQALSLDKSNALSYFLMGCTLAKLGQSDAAETCYRQAQSLDPRYAVRR